MVEHTQTHWGLMCRGVCEDWLIEHSTQIGEVPIRRSVYQCKTIMLILSGGITVDANLNIVPKIVELMSHALQRAGEAIIPV